MKFLKLRYFYLIILVLLLFTYLFPSLAHLEVQKEWLDIYFGNLIYLLFIVLLLYAIRMWIPETGGKVVFEIRIFLFLFCVFSALALFLCYQAGIDEKTIDITEKMRTELLDLSVYQYHLGLIAAYSLYLFSKLEMYPFYYYFYSLVGIFIISLFLLVFKPIKNKIQQYLHRKRKQKKREREERLLQEQMQIKRALEREEYRKKLQFEQRKEEIIQEKAKNFEMGKLMSSIDLSVEEEKEKR